MVAIDELIPYMRRVQAVEREMRELGLLWQMIESSAAISCPQDVQTILPTLVQTRERFDELQRRLVHALAAENVAQLQDDLAARAQCTIDILVRNLFERTADVGFLATDDVIRAFCAADAQQRADSLLAMRGRLQEYCAKYTVYDDVIVLDAAGNILVRLENAAGLTASTDQVVPDALASRGYVERFGRSDLAATDRPALLYGHRIDDQHGRAAGVLVLRFRFEDEMQRIFASVAEAEDHCALVLLDSDNRVIASNDTGHVPLDIKIRTSNASGVDLVSFAGREYLAMSCATHGYQSYLGPGWRAHAIVSLMTAFRSRTEVNNDSKLTLDNAELRTLQQEAEAINRNLRRVVWNGRLMAGSGDTARLKAVLTQVNQAGSRTGKRVRSAVGELHTASLGRACRQATDLARLAADIMDRNLYERANDCRWWALSPVLRRVLSAPADEAGTGAMNEVLGYINGLYTVYRRLITFDAAGVIRGLSHEDPARPLLGSSIDGALLQAARSLSGSQQYAVSPFVKSALSDDEGSYIYLAAVRGGDGDFAGGIALVFHSVREFTAMLKDVIGDRRGFAVFVDERDTVLASSGPEYAPGDALKIDAASAIANLGEERFAVARGRAAGYREFKTTDGYDNKVSVVVALRLGSVEHRRSEISAEPAASTTLVDRSQAVEAAIVQVGGACYALPVARVMSAYAPTRIVQTPSASPYCLGLIQVDGADGRSVIPVLSARRLFGITHAERTTDGIAIVLRRDGEDKPALGLWVDDVVAVVEVERSALQETPEVVRVHSPMVTAVFEFNDPSVRGLVQMIDPDRLDQFVGRTGMLTAAEISSAPEGSAREALPVPVSMVS